MIPAGFEADLAAGRTASVQVIVDGTNSNTGILAQGYATRAIQAYGLRRAAERRGVAPDPPVQLDARAWFNPGLVSRVYNVPAVVGMIVMLMSMLLTALSVVRERELGTLDQLLVSPLSAGELMLGKTIPVTAIAMVQLALVTIVALLWFRIPFRGSFLLLLFAAALFILAGLAVGLLISTVSRTQQEAFLGLSLTLFPVVTCRGSCTRWRPCHHSSSGCRSEPAAPFPGDRSIGVPEGCGDRGVVAASGGAGGDGGGGAVGGDEEVSAQSCRRQLAPRHIGKERVGGS